MQPPTADTTPRLRGDEDELYRRHHRELERAVARVVRAPHDLIEDACQKAWATLLRNQPERYAIFGWLRTVAIHEAYRLSAVERREAHLDAIPIEILERSRAMRDPRDVDDTLRAREGLRVLAALPEKQRRDLVLLVAGFSYKEIAAMTDRTYTNVDKTLGKARARVRLEELRSTRIHAGARRTISPS